MPWLGRRQDISPSVSSTVGNTPAWWMQGPSPAVRLPYAGVPYDLNPEFIQELFVKHRIDYIIHGDDPCLLPDGTDAYAHAKRLGRFKMVGVAVGVCMLQFAECGMITGTPEYVSALPQRQGGGIALPPSHLPVSGSGATTDALALLCMKYTVAAPHRRHPPLTQRWCGIEGVPWAPIQLGCELQSFEHYPSR